MEAALIIAGALISRSAPFTKAPEEVGVAPLFLMMNIAVLCGMTAFFLALAMLVGALR